MTIQSRIQVFLDELEEKLDDIRDEYNQRKQEAKTEEEKTELRYWRAEEENKAEKAFIKAVLDVKGGE